MNIESLKGKTLTNIVNIRNEKLCFLTKHNMYIMTHEQNCCESVYLDDICGDLNDLLHSPLLLAEERTNRDSPKDPGDESFTWTFYELATIKGRVTLRWYGYSNGYYSEEVELRNFDLFIHNDLDLIIAE